MYFKFLDYSVKSIIFGKKNSVYKIKSKGDSGSHWQSLRLSLKFSLRLLLSSKLNWIDITQLISIFRRSSKNHQAIRLCSKKPYFSIISPCFSLYFLTMCMRSCAKIVFSVIHFPSTKAPWLGDIIWLRNFLKRLAKILDTTL